MTLAASDHHPLSGRFRVAPCGPAPVIADGAAEPSEMPAITGPAAEQPGADGDGPCKAAVPGPGGVVHPAGRRELTR